MAYYNTDAIYTIDDAKKVINDNLIIAKEMLANWESVKRVEKKTGGDFANIERNFTTESAHTAIRFEYSVVLCKVILYYHSSVLGHTHDTIYILREDSANEIAYKIEKHIENLREEIDAKSRGYHATEKRLKAATKHMDKVKAILEEAKKDDTYHALRDYIMNYL